MELWIPADSRTSYCCNAQVYLGRWNNHEREVGQGRRVVLDLLQHIEGSGRNVTADQFFTSVDLGLSLLEKGLTLLWTINPRRREVPGQLRQSQRGEVHETIFGHSENIMLASYVPREIRVVIVISTMHDTHDITDQDSRLPEVIGEYNQLKGGVDVLNNMVPFSSKDQTVASCSLAKHSRHFWRECHGYFLMLRYFTK